MCFKKTGVQATFKNHPHINVLTVIDMVQITRKNGKISIKDQVFIFFWSPLILYGILTSQ